MAADPLTILLVGHGEKPIPPVGWGAVESLIWEYSLQLKAMGHMVEILNTPDTDQVIAHLSKYSYDFVHFHDDILVNILEQIPSRVKVVLTSHYPYIHDPSKWDDKDSGYNYGRFVMGPLVFYARRKRVHICAVSYKDRDALVSYGIPADSISVCVNGVNVSKFKVELGPIQHPNKTICMAQIIPRKRQHLFRGYPDIVCAGKINDLTTLPSQESWIGEWGDDKYEKLTQYGNAILLSDGENGTPLGIKESLAAGLGCVVSEAVANEIPKDWHWVHIIPESQIADLEVIKRACETNRVVAGSLKQQIREKTRDLWDWSTLVAIYIAAIRQALGI